jgi:hypothetical protein
VDAALLGSEGRNGSIMRLRRRYCFLAMSVLLVFGLLYLATIRPEWVPVIHFPLGSSETYEIEVTDYTPPESKLEEDLFDDRITDKNPAFIPDLIDRRREGDWQLNASSAVLRLDAPMLKPDADAALLELRASYALAMAKAPDARKVLPSINVIDGKAKQFDDGLFAAIDLAYYKGLQSRLESHVGVIKRIYEHLAPESAASAYLAAGLKIAGSDVKTVQPDQAALWLRRFESDAMYSKPFSFYTWSDELTRVFRFMRYFQQPLPPNPPVLIADLAHAVGSDKKLLEDYKRVNAFYAKLTNPSENLTLADVLERGGKYDGPTAIAVFPSCRSKETELFRHVFPQGLPPGSDLMRELIRAIHKGKIDLAPKPESGWYDYQLHALETFLMPEKGAENPKLLLTKSYKKRMLEAFQALMTKRRETHARDLAAAKSAEAMPQMKVKPRLRVEPCASFALRTARSYDFLLTFLLATVGEEGLATLHGWKEGGERSKTLLEELRWMREFFYGLHLLSAEDLGMAPGLRPDEPVDRAASEAKAKEWLASYGTDPDMQVDTRVSVPLYFDVTSRRTRLWATIGVRLAKLEVSYAKPPKMKAVEGTSEWRDVDPNQLEAAGYLIAVDEFAEIEIPGLEPLTRQELRDACDAQKTKDRIVHALFQRSP